MSEQQSPIVCWSKDKPIINPVDVKKKANEYLRNLRVQRQERPRPRPRAVVKSGSQRKASIAAKRRQSVKLNRGPKNDKNDKNGSRKKKTTHPSAAISRPRRRRTLSEIRRQQQRYMPKKSVQPLLTTAKDTEQLIITTSSDNSNGSAVSSGRRVISQFVTSAEERTEDEKRLATISNIEYVGGNVDSAEFAIAEQQSNRVEEELDPENIPSIDLDIVLKKCRSILSGSPSCSSDMVIEKIKCDDSKNDKNENCKKNGGNNTSESKAADGGSSDGGTGGKTAEQLLGSLKDQPERQCRSCDRGTSSGKKCLEEKKKAQEATKKADKKDKHNNSSTADMMVETIKYSDSREKVTLRQRKVKIEKIKCDQIEKSADDKNGGVRGQLAAAAKVTSPKNEEEVKKRRNVCATDKNPCNTKNKYTCVGGNSENQPNNNNKEKQTTKRLEKNKCAVDKNVCKTSAARKAKEEENTDEGKQECPQTTDQIVWEYHATEDRHRNNSDEPGIRVRCPVHGYELKYQPSATTWSPMSEFCNYDSMGATDY